MRGPWLTSVLGAVLLVGIPVEFLTGLLSYAAYNPKLAGNDPNPDHGILGLYLFDWFTRPSWLYRLTEGVHVMLGLALVPVVLAKLWSVIPKLFIRPALHSLAHLLERLSLLLLVGGIVFEMTTGVLDIDYWGVYRFNFYTGHFFGAWMFIAGFGVHVLVKLRPMARALRSRSFVGEMRTGLDGTVPELLDDPLVAVTPDAPTISRRGILALVGGTSLAVVVMTAGETIGGRFRSLALLAPRDRSSGTGANHFPVNHTAASHGVTVAATGPAWRLSLVGRSRATLRRSELLAMPLTTARLPIACTEGWSTVQLWTGVTLADLARRAGTSPEDVVSATLETIDAGGLVVLSGAQVRAPTALLALRVNGAELSLDHGFPARVIVPDTPGEYNRKWIRRIVFTVAG